MLSNLKGVVLPENPVIDKLIATAIVIWWHTKKFTVPEDFQFFFWDTNQEPGEEKRAEWLAAGIFPIDIGRDKYHSRKTGSASETVCVDLGINLEEHPEIQWLVRAANRNNKDGWMKGAADGWNIAFIIRELYKAGEEVTLIAEEVTQFALKYIQYGSQRVSRADEFTEPFFVGLTKKDQFVPFTIRHLCYTLFEIPDCDFEHITEIISAWKEFRKQGQRLEAKAGRQARLIEKTLFQINHVNCFVVHTDDVNIPRAILYQTNDMGILICRESGGKVAILTHRSRINVKGYRPAFTAFFEALTKAENDDLRWFHDTRICAALNGSKSLNAVEPTKLSDDQIIEIAQQHLRF